MQKNITTEQLRASILLLESKQSQERMLLKEELKITYDNLKPINLIKNAFHELTSETDLKGDFLNTTIGLAAGYLSKKAAIGSASNPLKKIFGTLLQMGVTSIVSKNADRIRSASGDLINNIFSKKEKAE